MPEGVAELAGRGGPLGPAAAALVDAAGRAVRANPGRLIAAGYSNGVNVAYAMPLLQPGVLAAAVLFRAMPPTPPD